MKKAAKVITTSADPDVENLLEKISEGKRVLNPQKGDTIFSQGDRADAIFFIQSGKVKITVVSSAGKEAVIAVLGAHSFLGEGALVGQPLLQRGAYSENGTVDGCRFARLTRV